MSRNWLMRNKKIELPMIHFTNGRCASLNLLTPGTDQHLISPNNKTPELHKRSWEWRKWSPTEKALDCQRNSPYQHLRWCKQNSMENMHPEVRMWKAYTYLYIFFHRLEGLFTEQNCVFVNKIFVCRSHVFQNLDSVLVKAPHICPNKRHSLLLKSVIKSY